MKITQEQALSLSRQFGVPVESLEGKTVEQARAAVANAEITCRAAISQAPTTANEDIRTVDVVLATEAPVMIFDGARWEVVDEVLTMAGLRLSEIRQGKLPLLDSHQRYTAKNVLGSTTNLRIEGDKLVGTRHYSEVCQAEFRKTVEGHLDQASVGYRVYACTYIEPGQSAVINGKTYSAPANRALKLVTDWIALEDSACPIGADPESGVRSLMTITANKTTPTNTEKERTMENTATPPAATPPAVPDVAGIRAAAIAEERSRQEGIRSMCTKLECNDKAEELVSKGLTIDEAQRQIVEIVLARAAAASTPKAGVGVVVTTDERDKVRAAMSDALSMRCGHTVDKPAAGADELRGFTMLDMGREILRRSGQSYSGNAMEIAKRALSTSDLPLILANAANKSLNVAFNTATETYKTWCGEGEVSDFKENTLVRISETDDLLQVKEGEGYKYSSRSDAKETFRVYKYGRLFAYTWESMVNDDLAALNDIPAQHGEACLRLEGDIAYAVLTANAAMGDGTALFHANHGNVSGGAGAIAQTTLAAGIKAMKLQKDIGGKRRLNIRPVFVIGPATIEGAAEVFFGSTLLSSNMQTNPYSGSYFTRVYDARLDDTSTSDWYLAGPKGQTVKVFYLRGNRAPYLESQMGFGTDGIEFKVRHVVGAKAVDWKALFKNTAA
jgi:hypothetical protein